MGATRKLALIVVIGLIAVSTAMTVYTANEPNRRDEVTSNQQGLSIERASSLYVTYCLQCHGPAGLGSAEVDADGNPMGRTGAPLNQSTMTDEQLQNAKAIFQSDDPVAHAIAEDFIRFRILYGAPAEAQLYQTYNQAPAMPAFRHDLNVEQINSLVWLIMEGDWNYVYNYAVHQTGLGVCDATPEADRTDACLGEMEEAAAYPTVPPTAAPEGEDGAAEADNGGDAEAAPSGDGTDHQVETTDNAFSTNSIVVKPGDTITVTNNGFAQHDLVSEQLGIGTELLNNGDTVTITIPADAKPGDYEYICTVVGHKESGMIGTVTVEAP